LGTRHFPDEVDPDRDEEPHESPGSSPEEQEHADVEAGNVPSTEPEPCGQENPRDPGEGVEDEDRLLPEWKVAREVGSEGAGQVRHERPDGGQRPDHGVGGAEVREEHGDDGDDRDQRQRDSPEGFDAKGPRDVLPVALERKRHGGGDYQVGMRPTTNAGALGRRDAATRRNSPSAREARPASRARGRTPRWRRGAPQGPPSRSRPPSRP